MKKISKNVKLNAVLNEIANDLEEMGMNEVRRYRENFPRETDYNIVQYGNLLIYYYDVREMYKRAGYKTMDKWSDSRVWETYKRQVGYMAEKMVRGLI